MFFVPRPLGEKHLPDAEVRADVRACRKTDRCGVGEKALYIGTRFIARGVYLPWKEIRRVFKRVAMSPGGFSGKGVFGSMAYLVVQYGKSGEVTCHFRREDELDAMLELVGRNHPSIPLHSAEAERKLAAVAAVEALRYNKPLSPEGEAALAELRAAKGYLEDNGNLNRRLVAAAKQKRIVDAMKPGYRIGGVIAAAGSVGLALAGLYGWLTHAPYAAYALLIGGVVFFFTLSTNLLPSRWTSKKYAQQEWDASVASVKAYISQREGFPVPAQYAHPIVLERMIRVVREGRAESTQAALEAVKADLRALNSSVSVSRQEHDEVVEVKPLFLVCDYRDEV